MAKKHAYSGQQSAESMRMNRGPIRWVVCGQLTGGKWKMGKMAIQMERPGVVPILAGAALARYSDLEAVEGEEWRRSRRN